VHQVLLLARADQEASQGPQLLPGALEAPVVPEGPTCPLQLLLHLLLLLHAVAAATGVQPGLQGLSHHPWVA
jgi:hypothetical protein